MPLDPVIAGGFRGLQLQDPLEQYSRINQLQQVQQQNALNALKMQEYQRGLQEQNALRGAIRPDFDPANPQHQAELYRAAPTLAAGVIEKAMMTRKTAADIAKAKAEEDKLKAETQDKQLRALGVGLTNVLKDPSDAALARTFDTLDATGVNTQPFRAQFAQIPDAEARRQIIMNYATSHPEGRAALEFVRPKVQEVGTGGAKKFIDQNPNSPTFGKEVIPSVAMTATPGEVLTAQTTRRGQDITAETTRRGQDITATTAKAGQELQRELAFKPAYNSQAGGFVVPPSAAAPQGAFIPLSGVSATKDQQAAIKALQTAGYDPLTGKDRIEELIKKSTGGLAQAGAAEALSFFNITTSGREAIGALGSRANQIALDLAGGKLGAGISNQDRDFLVTTLGDVANPRKSAGERLAAWNEAKARMLVTGMIPPPKPPSKDGAPAPAPAPASPNIDALLDKYR